MSATDKSDGTRLKVLLVDDDARYLELVAMMLEDEGFDVTCATSGQQCLQQLESGQPDVIVLDIILGAENGIELSKRIKLSNHGSDVPIVFLSAWTGQHETSLPRDTMRLFKPFTQNEIAAAIKSVTRHEQLER